MKWYPLALALLLTGKAAHAQTKVASYACGTPGTDTYEHLSFWAKDGQRTSIYYVYGKERKEVKLKYLSKFQLNKKPGFKAQFANGHVLAVVPSGSVLQVRDATAKAPKTFAWEYEGPVNGVGTFCRECAENKEAAMQLVRATYLN